MGGMPTIGFSPHFLGLTQHPHPIHMGGTASLGTDPGVNDGGYGGSVFSGGPRLGGRVGFPRDPIPSRPTMRTPNLGQQRSQLL